MYVLEVEEKNSIAWLITTIIIIVVFVIVNIIIIIVVVVNIIIIIIVIVIAFIIISIPNSFLSLEPFHNIKEISREPREARKLYLATVFKPP